MSDCALVRGRPGGRATALRGDILRGEMLIWGWVVCRYNISESIIMARRPPTTETRSVLRTILSAGVLAGLSDCVRGCGGGRDDTSCG